MKMNRREVLKIAATASLSLYGAPLIANQNQENKKKLVWVILRGGMDGLHSTIPAFDKNLTEHRSNFTSKLKNNGLPIDKGFLLHPKLKFMHKLYRNNEMSAIVATSIPNSKRSHFDAQDLLESGLPHINRENGWLARSLTELNKLHIKTSTNDALAISRTLPIALRGNDNSRTWYPSTLPPTKEDFHQRLFQMYENDEDLYMSLKQALATDELVNSMRNKRQDGKFQNLAQSCAAFMGQNNGPNIAMLESFGWDTHKDQEKKLEKRFQELDNGLRSLKLSLDKKWDDTLVIITTEFGRTIKENGTKGTDHGTATTMFIGGGALKDFKENQKIQGGKVLGKWPGLAKEQLFEGRDLMPTSNTFDWIASALQQHWQLSNSQIARIFPKA